MKKSFKVFFTLLATLLLLGGVTAVVVSLVIDPNDFKTQIEAAVQDNTARVLRIEGDVKLSLFPWLGLSTGKMHLSNATGFGAEPFAQISHSRIKLKLWTLLFDHQLEISEIILKGLQLNLITNPEGLSNWSDLVALINTHNDSANPLKLLEIATIHLKQANIIWNNQARGELIQLQDVNLTANKLRFNQPTPLQLSFKLHSQNPLMIQTVALNTRMQLTEDLDIFQFNHSQLQWELRNNSLPSGQLKLGLLANVRIDLTRHQFSMAILQLKNQRFNLSAQLSGLLQQPFTLQAKVHIPTFDAAQWLQQQAIIVLPKMADENALRWLNADFNLYADIHQLQIKQFVMQFDETTVKGDGQLTNWSQPAARFNLALDTLNADRYLPPPSQEEIVNPLPKTTTRKEISWLSLERVRQLNITGQININELKINNLTMQGIQLSVSAKEGVLRSQHSVNKLYQGAYSGKWFLDITQQPPLLALNEQLTHIQLEPLFRDIEGELSLGGLLSLNAKLEARGYSTMEMKSSLNGKINFLLKNALIRGFNLAKMLENGKIFLGSNVLSTDDKRNYSLFSNVSGTAIMTDGILINNDLLAIAHKIKVSGNGLINFILQRIDYRIVAILPVAKIGMPENSLTSLPILINVGGSLNAPTYQVDLIAMGLGI